jgi:nanoRNase/pAp phosphatase (c-di-AMP/oligoRNAs hydrolase)
VIDHHRNRSRKAHSAFCDIRPEVGATSSIVFSYFMELEVPIRPDLGATLLYAIESDLAGAAGQPGELDNLALSSLTLIADTRKLYQMRHVDLPQSYFVSYFLGLQHAVWAENAVMSHVEQIESLERPAILADFLLRFDQVNWALVTAVHGDRLLMSLRTQSKTTSAADVMRKLVRHWGTGGGHRTKAGGFVPLPSKSPADIDRARKRLWNRYLKALGHKPVKGQKLVARDPVKP